MAPVFFSRDYSESRYDAISDKNQRSSLKIKPSLIHNVESEMAFVLP